MYDRGGVESGGRVLNHDHGDEFPRLLGFHHTHSPFFIAHTVTLATINVFLEYIHQDAVYIARE